MIRKRIKNIFRLIFLIAVRQTIKLLSNVYNLLNQPLQTMKKLLVVDKDKSQIFLVAALTFFPIILYVSGRLIVDTYRYGTLLNTVGEVFVLTLVVELIIILYLGYWIFMTFKKK